MTRDECTQYGHIADVRGNLAKHASSLRSFLPSFISRSPLNSTPTHCASFKGGGHGLGGGGGCRGRKVGEVGEEMEMRKREGREGREGDISLFL